MSSQNRLLAMLNTATSQSPSLSQTQTQTPLPVPDQSASIPIPLSESNLQLQQNNILQYLNSNSNCNSRRPDLDLDLDTSQFQQPAEPPVPLFSPPTASTVNASNGRGGNHQNRLLDMLMTLGSPSAAANNTKPTPATATATANPATSGPNATAPGIPAPSNGSTRDIDRLMDNLGIRPVIPANPPVPSSVRSDATANKASALAPTGPVIKSERPSQARDADADDGVAELSFESTTAGKEGDLIETGSSQSVTSALVALPQVEQPAPAPPISAPAPALVPPPTSTPKKSMFDFISPFDAFDKPVKAVSPAPKPPARQQTPTASASTSVKPVEASVMDVKTSRVFKAEQKSVASHQVPTPTITGSTSKIEPAKPSTPHQAATKAASKPTTAVEKRDLAARAGSPARSETSSVNKADLGLVWQINKVARDVKGKGPKQHLVSSARIDFSQDGTDRLVNDPGQVQVIPMTLMKSDSVEFRKGRNVGITQGWIVYPLSKGRLRLIDRSSGAKLVLQLPESARGGPVLDIAVTPTQVAVVGFNSSISVFQVPENWENDNPLCRLTAHIAPSTQTDEETVGQVFKVDWFTRNGEHWLAAGGSGGLVMFKPEQALSGSTIDNLGSVLLTTDGDMISFCFNHSNQAVGLLSATHFTLYNASTAHRVWHRELPSSSPELAPTSVHFCESNILVGRANNTVFDLIQITIDLAVISTIVLDSPSPSPSHLHYSQVIYDSARTTLWIAPISRGSILAFRYIMKGQPPIKGASSPPLQGTIKAFDQVAEFPLEPVISVVLVPGSAEQDPELFFSTPTGFSQATIDREPLFMVLGEDQEVENNVSDDNRSQDHSSGDQATEDALIEAEAAEEPSALQTAPAAKKAVPTPNRSSTAPSDFPPAAAPIPASTWTVPVPRTAPLAPAVIAPPTRPTETQSKNEQSEDNLTSVGLARIASKQDSSNGNKGDVSIQSINSDDLSKAINNDGKAAASSTKPAMSSDDVAKLLKKTEDRLSNNIKQQFNNQFPTINARLDTLQKAFSAAHIAAKVEKQVKASLSSIVSQEIKQSVLPTISITLTKEVERTTKDVIQKTVEAALRDLPAQVDRAIAAAIERSITSHVQPALKRSVDHAVQSTILPAISSSRDQLTQQVSSVTRSEIVKNRSDMKLDEMSTMLHSMAKTMTDLQHRLVVLSEEQAAVKAHMASSASVPAPARLPQQLAPAPPIGSGPVNQRHTPGVNSTGMQPAHPSDHTVQRPLGIPHNQDRQVNPHVAASQTAGVPFNQIEDAIVETLHDPEQAALINLVRQHDGVLDRFLPPARSISPNSPRLSQAVLLTMLHRIAQVIPTINPADDMMRSLSTWSHRAACLLDFRDPLISSYITPVLDSVLETLDGYVANCPPHAHRYHIDSVKQVIGELRPRIASFKEEQRRSVGAM